MSAGHTPGPWQLKTVTTSCGICHKIGPFIGKENRETHACVYVDYPSGHDPVEHTLLANARLIAAAPELLEAVTQLLSDHKPGIGQCCKAADFALAALAKATGEKVQS